MIYPNNILDLKNHGYCILSDPWLDITESKEHIRSRQLREANITHGSSGYRTDRISWLTHDDNFESKVLGKLDEIRVLLNRTCFLNLKDVESHFAKYDKSAKYGRHLDATKVNNKRKISLVSYLNVGWKDEFGGKLRLHLQDRVLDISPNYPTTVLFLSEEIEHEVLESFSERLSLVAWFRE